MADLIDEIMKVSEEEVQYFSDVVGAKRFSPNEQFRLSQTAKFKEESQKFVKISHGPHESHYVWHISTTHPKRSWSVSIDRVLYAVGKILNERMPHDIVIDIFLPDPNLGIDEITVKANEANDHWSLNEGTFQRITGSFFEVLNTLI